MQTQERDRSPFVIPRGRGKPMFRQLRVDADTARERFNVAKSYVNLTRALVEVAFPDIDHSAHSDLDTLLVLLSVLIGDGDGRPMSATKIAQFTAIPRPTVHRKLESLLSAQKIVRRGTVYHYAPAAMKPDPTEHLSKAVMQLCSTIDVSKMDT